MEAHGSLYGAYSPGPVVSRLIAWAQATPRTGVGAHFAGLLRALALRAVRGPIDVAVGPLRMRCFPHDNHAERKFVFTPWRFDPEERAFLAETLPADGTFVDVGANVGIYTLTAAQILNDAGRIIAFEPNPPILERLHFNIAASRAVSASWPDIEVCPVGISDTEQRMDLYLRDGNLGASSIVGREARSGQVQIECRPLLAALRGCGVERIDALKIDIEGAEDRALIPFLQDAEPGLLPRHVIVERSEHLWQQDLPGAMSACGYRCRLTSRLNRVFSLD